MSRRSRMGVVATIGILLATIGWAVADTRTPRKPVDWVALYARFAGARFVNDSGMCRECHEDSMRTYHDTAHARAFGASPPANVAECEGCHGSRSRHLEDPTIDLRFEALTARQQSAICLQCHEGGSRFGWKAGPHHVSDMSCASSHIVMERKSERALLKKATVTDTCYQQL